MSEDEKTSGERWIEAGHFGWFVKYEYDRHWLDFRAYQCVGEDVTPEPGKKFFRKRGTCVTFAYLEDLEEAEIAISGYVKWDGCCAMRFEEQQPHFCGSQDVAEYAKAMMELHKLALMIPALDYECAGYPEPAQ